MGTKKLVSLISIVFVAIGVAYLSYGIYQKPKETGTEFVSEIPEFNVKTFAVNDSLQERIVSYGMDYLGTPYVESGCSKDGFDCSGFVYFVFQHFKINVPRSSASFANFGTEIPLNEVQKGDLLLFLSPTRDVIGHIGIVSKANGIKSDFIHASSGREMKVILTSMTNKGYTKRFVKAIRVIGK